MTTMVIYFLWKKNQTQNPKTSGFPACILETVFWKYLPRSRGKEEKEARENET